MHGFLRSMWSRPAAMSDESDVDLRFVSNLTLDGPMTFMAIAMQPPTWVSSPEVGNSRRTWPT